jgi:chromosome partitioning protein
MTATVIAVSQGKGGVAKTTTSMNLSRALREKGYRTIVCDWDLEKPDAHKWMKNGNESNCVVLIDKDKAVSQVEQLKTQYDIVIFDTPPNYDSGAFKAVMAADFVIIPTSSNYLDQENAQDATSLPMLAKKPFKLLMSKVKKSTKDYKDINAQAAYETICFNAIITDRAVMAQCPNVGLWVGELAKNGDNHSQFSKLAEEVIAWTTPEKCHTCGTETESSL